MARGRSRFVIRPLCGVPQDARCPSPCRDAMGCGVRATLSEMTAKALIATVLVFVIVAGAAIDVAAFGPHDHLTDEMTHKASSSNGSGVHGTHHCDLSANPADVAPLHDVPLITLMGAVAPEEVASTVLPNPFVPLTPPRA